MSFDFDNACFEDVRDPYTYVTRTHYSSVLHIDIRISSWILTTKAAHNVVDGADLPAFSQIHAKHTVNDSILQREALEMHKHLIRTHLFRFTHAY